MKSLKFLHSARIGQDPGVPPKLKPFNALAQKLSSILWIGGVSVAAIVSVLSVAPDALATTLRPGLAGPEVARLQAALGIHVDGLYGPQTASAVAAYQRACGLLVDGIAGRQTLSTLYSGACPPGGVAVHSYSGYYEPSYSSSSSYRSSYTPIYSRNPYGESYVVVIPEADEDDLDEVRRICPDAYFDALDRIPFINAGEYPSYEEALRISNRLIGLGFDARVEYRDY